MEVNYQPSRVSTEKTTRYHMNWVSGILKMHESKSWGKDTEKHSAQTEVIAPVCQSALTALDVQTAFLFPFAQMYLDSKCLNIIVER